MTEGLLEEGYTIQQAQIEAQRCLMCANAPCSCDCPAGVDARGFIRKIRFGNLDGAVKLLKSNNVLSGSCGYICPTKSQCAKGCRAEGLTVPIDIGGLQRFVMDHERLRGMIEPATPKRDGKKVAVIGAGPAGLGCAAELAVCGHIVTVFEAGPETGGMLRKVIPSFRLPPAVIDFEVEFIKKLGVEFECMRTVERPQELLSHGFDAVFVGAGLQRPLGGELIGSNIAGVHQALDLLSMSKSGRMPDPGRRVVVVGGGDTAIDAARVSKRAGAECFIIYRRTQREMPAYPEEIEAAWNDGVEFYFRVMPRSIVGTDKVTGVRCVRIRWQPAVPGSERTYEVEGAEFVIPCDTFIYATGQGAVHNFGLRTTTEGYLAVHKETMMTSTPGIFAGGDCVTGGGTAAWAVGAGKQAAVQIDKYLNESSLRGARQ
jgi:glutamate synthase (NADPH/NADH) small chain